MKVRNVALSIVAGLFGAGLAVAVPAAAGSYPTPSPTATVAATPTPTPTLPTVPPTVNPFAGCNFSTTFAFTFDPARGRFVREVVPAIVCDPTGLGGRVSVYDLVRNGR
jgi:hypothetical protein